MYIEHLGGDKNHVTAVGGSAGGISISNQLLAADPPTFHHISGVDDLVNKRAARMGKIVR